MTSTSMLTSRQRALVPERRDRRGVGDDGDAEGVVVEIEDGEADAVDGDRALLDAVAHELASACGRGGRGPARTTSPTASTWPCTTWPPSRSSTRTGRSRLTGSSDAEVAQVGARRTSRSLTSATHQPSPCSTRVRQAPFTAIESPIAGVVEHDVVRTSVRRSGPIAIDAAELLHDPGEHQCITIPPVTLIDWPVHDAASSDANHRTTPATSATVWRRPSGDPAVHAATCSGVRVSAPISVRT